jgi:hypothetical protein
LTLAVGTRFGAYELAAPLGASGMGKVYFSVYRKTGNIFLLGNF